MDQYMEGKLPIEHYITHEFQGVENIDAVRLSLFATLSLHYLWFIHCAVLASNSPRADPLDRPCTSCTRASASARWSSTRDWGR